MICYFTRLFWVVFFGGGGGVVALQIFSILINFKFIRPEYCELCSAFSFLFFCTVQITKLVTGFEHHEQLISCKQEINDHIYI